ncbi:MAG: hypothetical protein ACREBO_09885 [Novosphingobium sp.]
MIQLIFRNRYAALVWVGLSLFGAAAFVGEGGGAQQVDKTTAQVRAQAEELTAAPTAEPSETAEGQAAESEEALAESEGEGDDKVFTGPDGRRYRVVSRDDAGKLARGESID